MARQKRITMQDIAKLTGSSITTVSHVINRTRHVDAEVRGRILETAESLGYNTQRANSPAKNKAIGMVIADIRVDYFSDVTKNVEGIARAAGYNLIFCDSEEREADEAVCIDMLLAHDVAGIILAPCSVDTDYSRLLDRQLPVVLLDRNTDSRDFDFVGIDNAQSSARVTRCLWDQGARNVAFIGHLGPQFTTRERIAGYRSALLELGSFDPQRILLIDSHAEGTHEIADFMLRHGEVDGVVCQSSNACFETLDTLTELGDAFASKMRMASWDDSKWFDLLRYPITAVSQPTGDLAAVATELLIEKIENPRRSTVPKSIILDYELKIRT